MKEVVKVSISGIAFTFDADAYRLTDDYLKKLESGYARHPDGREIVADIEARIAELILEHQESDKVVGRELAENVIGKMGFPDDMNTEDDIPVKEFPRRLYRDPNGAKLAGICSGLGTYFRIDTTWIRLGVFAPLVLAILAGIADMDGLSGLMGSLFVLIAVLYIVLWIAVPMAKSPRQKLEMRGEKITASSIEQNFRADAAVVSGQGKPGRSEKSASVWADVVYVIGRILLVFVKIVVGFIAFGFAMAGIAILVAIVALVSGSGWALTEGLPVSDLLGLVGITPVAFAVIWLAVILIPIFILVYFLIKVIFSARTNRPLLVTLWVVWFVLLVYAVIITAVNGQYLRDKVSDDIDRLKEYTELHVDVNDDTKYYRSAFGPFIWNATTREVYRKAFDSDPDVRDGMLSVSGTRDAMIRRVDGGPVTVEYSSGRRESAIFHIGEPDPDGAWTDDAWE